MKKIVCLLAAIALALYAQASVQADDFDLLDQICRREPVPKFSSISQLMPIVELFYHYSSFSPECSKKMVESVDSFNLVLIARNIRSPKTIDLIVDFWKKYISKSSEDERNFPFTRSFVAFGFQVSKVCKLALIEMLAKAHEERHISQEDVDFVTKPIGNSKLVDELTAKGGYNLEDLMVVVDINPVGHSGLKSLEEKKNERENWMVSVTPEQKKIIEQIQSRCLSKFKPIYNTLMLSVVRLAAIGFNYKADHIEAKLEELKKQTLYRDYYTAVLTCESVLRFVPVVIKDRANNGDVGYKQTMTFLDANDIFKLKKEDKLILEGPVDDNYDNYELDDSFGVDDLLVDDRDKFFMEAIQSYLQSSRPGYDTRKKLITGELLTTLKSHLKSDKFRFGLGEASLAEKTRIYKMVAGFGSRDPGESRVSFINNSFRLGCKVGISKGWARFIKSLCALSPLCDGLWTAGSYVLGMDVFSSLFWSGQ